jgi:hypothetical protein
MASVLLSTVGQGLGGNIAGAIGALAGQGADARIFGLRRGLPALPAVQRASYGEVVPRVYGRFRQAGTVVWASPIRYSDGGKGGDPDRRRKFVTLAIAVSSRAIVEVGRIWADGAEFRDASGNFATPTTMRVYRGNREQPADSAIEAEEGIGGCPAFRSYAYVVFENVPLDSFGNRIPSFSFEVIADVGDSDAGAWLVDLAGQAGVSAQAESADFALLGLAASEEDWRSSITALNELASLVVDSSREQLHFSCQGRIFELEPADLLDARGSDSRSNKVDALPLRRVRTRTITYLDSDRDFQWGSQAASVAYGSKSVSTSHNMSSTATQMRARAFHLLHQQNRMGEVLTLALSWKWIGLRPGDHLLLADVPGKWQIIRVEFRDLTLMVHCCCSVELPFTDLGPSDPGRALSSPLAQVPPTRLRTMELPLRSNRAPGPALTVLATGTSGWKGAVIEWTPPGSSAPRLLGTSRKALPFGKLVENLSSNQTQLWDEWSELVIETEGEEMNLFSQSGSEALVGSLRILVDDELIGFRSVAWDGGVRWTLRGLLRGQLFTRPSSHQAGTEWYLVDTSTLLEAPMEAAWLQGEVRTWATGPGDGNSPVERVHLLSGVSAAPLSPCHLEGGVSPSAGIWVSWFRRDRESIDWSAGEPADIQGFAVRVRDAADRFGPMGIWFTQSTQLHVSIPELIEKLGPNVDLVEVSVEAMGTGPSEFRTSAPIEIRLASI